MASSAGRKRQLGLVIPPLDAANGRHESILRESPLQAFAPRDRPTKVSNGFLFDLTLNGIISTQSGNKLSQVALDCEVKIEKVVDCDGTLKVAGHGSADIFLSFDSDDGMARWAIDVNASNALKITHDLWGEEIVPHVLGNTSTEWDYVEWFDGSQWRVFYYSTTWAETFQSITGLPYDTVTDIWTW